MVMVGKNEWAGISKRPLSIHLFSVFVTCFWPLFLSPICILFSFLVRFIACFFLAAWWCMAMAFLSDQLQQFEKEKNREEMFLLMARQQNLYCHRP
jgi:hypothetical protein